MADLEMQIGDAALDAKVKDTLEGSLIDRWRLGRVDR
jgi:hypothetical protein